MKTSLLKTTLLVAALCLVGGGKALAQSKPTAGVEVAAGDYYIYNIGADRYLTHGTSYNTHATVDGAGEVITTTLSNGAYTLHFASQSDGTVLGTDNYVDKASSNQYYTTWTFSPVTLDGYTNVYQIKSASNTYLYWAGGSGQWGNEALTAEDISSIAANNTYWLLIPKATREAYSDASETNPVDATWRIANPDFERFNGDSYNGWAAKYFAGQSNGTAGTVAYFCEHWTGQWNSTVGSGDKGTLYDDDITQTLTYLPAGKYTLSANTWAQNQYDTSISEITGVTFYAGTSSVALNAAASTTPTTLEFTTTGGDVAIGVKIASTNASWVGFDNVRLTYYGATEDQLKAGYESALAAAKNAQSSSDYTNVTGTEKTALDNAISTYGDVTDATQYQTAISALNEATEAFVAAKDSYDAYAVQKAIADKLGATYNVTVNSADDIVAALQTLNVAEYNVSATYTDVTSSLDKDWDATLGSGSGQHWSGSGSYQDSNGTDVSKSITKTISLPAGTYILKAAGRGNANATVTMEANGTTVTFPSLGDTGYGINTSGAADYNSADTYANDNKGRGWQWRFIPVTLTAETEITVTVKASTSGWGWFSFSDFAILADATTAANLSASAAEYTALNNAINAVSGYVIGFEKDEYAPYNNVDAVKALAAAQAIDQKATNTSSAVTSATSALTNAKWTANIDEVNAVYDGTLATATVSVKSGDANAAMQALGWSANGESYRLVLGDATTYPALSQTTDGRAVFTWGGTFKYGETAGYTMPLKANTKYQITFKYCGWTGANNSFGVSVLDSNGKGLETTTYEKASNGPQTAGAFISVRKVFTTGDAGNYILSMIPNGNSTFADVSIIKAVADEVAFEETETEAPKASEYANVTLNRSFAQGWNSIVLPFETTPAALGADEAAEYKGTEGTTINFSKVTTLAANTPYLVYFASAKTDATVFDGVKIDPATELTVSDGNNQFDFVGTYTANPTISEGDYIVVSNGIQMAAGGNKLNAFRAFFKAKSATAKAMSISIDGNVVTGINAVSADELDDAPAYNLAGQRVGKSYKGVIVKNGKKVIRK